MVHTPLLPPETRLAVAYAPPPARASLSALFALDATLAQILRATREPMVGQMRLTWWYEALVALDGTPPPAEPVLRALHADVLPLGVTGTMLAGIVDGWEVLLEADLDDDAVARFAVGRGARLFTAAAILLGQDDARIAAAGEGWAMADLRTGLTDRARATSIGDAAIAKLDIALQGRWPRPLRALGALALLARADCVDDPDPPGSPRRIGRILIHRLTGY